MRWRRTLEKYLFGWVLGLALSGLAGCAIGPSSPMGFVNVMDLKCVGHPIGPSSQCVATAAGAVSCPAAVLHARLPLWPRTWCGWSTPRNLVRITSRPDGRVAYVYSYRGTTPGNVSFKETCVYALDVNPKTGIIRTAHWITGSRSACGLAR